MKRFFYTPDAAQDLADIGGHIARSSPSAAKKVIKEIRAAVRKLASQPGLGHLRPDLTPLQLRFWSVYSYLIIYDCERKPIEIIRVLHGARDVAEILREN